jgi:hypothetical protein
MRIVAGNGPSLAVASDTFRVASENGPRCNWRAISSERLCINGRHDAIRQDGIGVRLGSGKGT